MSPIVLGYWDIRGYAQPIRLLLAAVGADWIDKLYEAGGPPDFSKEEWFAIKKNLPLDFPNLPYLYDGDVKISQSVAILRYLSRKYGLDGKTEQEKIRIDLLEQQLIDYRSAGSQVWYNPNFQTLVVAYKEDLPNELATVSKFLGSHHYFSGGGLSYVDFLAYEWLDIQRLLVPDVLSAFPNLQAFVKRIEDQPVVKKFMHSDKFIKFPLNGNRALWGSKFTPI